MKYLTVDVFKELNDFWILESDHITIGFSNVKNERSFNRNTEDGKKNLRDLIDQFEVEEVIYLKQIHSNKVLQYERGDHGFNDNEGDGIVTNEKGILLGVFTADCVPVILLDNERKVISVVHSGWKGTFTSIVKEAIKEMEQKYNTNVCDIKAYIGPHIRQCCYEVSHELKDKFIKKFNVDKEMLFKKRNLSMELCIENDLLSVGVNSKEIYSLQLCTCCEKKEKLFSYRASNGECGRMLSVAFIK